MATDNGFVAPLHIQYLVFLLATKPRNGIKAHLDEATLSQPSIGSEMRVHTR
jgi:hypothetical protein